MTQDELLQKLSTLKRAPGTGQSAGMRAPHKPLFLLILLSKILNDPTQRNAFPFDSLKNEFNSLWTRFGWMSASRAIYPFWCLTTDQIWQLRGATQVIDTKGLNIPSEGWVRANVREGAFPDAVWHLLQDKGNCAQCAELLVQTYFPESMHGDLREQLRLSQEELPKTSGCKMRSGRNPAEQKKFRDSVMLAYEGKCAICSFGPNNTHAPSAIQAAHIWPVEYGGPFEVLPEIRTRC